jgi:hypothetical protein
VYFQRFAPKFLEKHLLFRRELRITYLPLPVMTSLSISFVRRRPMLKERYIGLKVEVLMIVLLMPGRYLSPRTALKVCAQGFL